MSESDEAFFQPRIMILFCLITLIWSSTWLVIKAQLTSVPPSWSVTYRFMIGSVAMFGYAVATRSSLRIGRDGHVLAAGFGILQFSINFNLIYLASRHVTSGLLAVIFALLLVPNSILAWLFLKHRIDRGFLAGSFVAVIGVALLIVQELRNNRLESGEIVLGVSLSLLALLCASAGNVLQAAERLRSRSLPGLVAWAMAYGSLADALFSWTVYGPPTFETNYVYVGGLLYLGLIASAFAFSFYLTVIRAIGPAKAAYSSLIIPILAMLLSTLVEGYRWSFLAVLGGILALAGLFIALRTSRRDAQNVIPAD
jgi:drug/metabolite transporter (DMT)-like permease